MEKTELPFLSATELSRLIKSRAVSPVEATEAYLERIEAVDGVWDLVFSHAALQWVDDHEALMPRLLSRVAPGGQLVVQMPSNHRYVTHTLILELAGSEPFRTALDGWVRPSPVLSIEAYAEMLYANGGREITIFEKVYPHELPDADAVADWTSGTALVPYLERLGNARETFMEQYRERLRRQWPSGPVFYPFRRILFATTRTG